MRYCCSLQFNIELGIAVRYSTLADNTLMSYMPRTGNGHW